MVRARDASHCNGQASDRLLNCTIPRLHMQASSAELIRYSEGSACPHLKGSNARTFCCKSVVTTVIFPVGIQSNIHVALIFTIKCLDTSKQAVNLSGQKKEVIVLYIKSATQWSKGYGNSFKM